MGVVIVGAGQAGAWVARSLRGSGYQGSVTLLGREPSMPYERPPLSKSVLSGEEAHPPVLLTAQQCDSLGVNFLPCTEVIGVDRTKREVTSAQGTIFPYSKLVLTTGGRARKLSCPGAELPGVYSLRTVEDSRAIAGVLQPGSRLLVVGGGWIGLEIAATARKKQVQVTLLEAGPRLCARTVPPVISDVLLRWHTTAGVQVRLSTTIDAIDSGTSRALRATIANWNSQEYDAIVVGIGLAVETGLAEQSGLLVHDGIVVDQTGRTSDPDIYAAGDVASQVSSWVPGRLRLESWANAQNQAIVVGKTLAGMAVTYDDAPWFWSDQYGKNLQILGIPSNDMEGVLRGSLHGDSFSIFQLSNGKIHSAIAVNSPRDIKVAKRWMRDGSCPPAAVIGDPAVRLDKL